MPSSSNELQKITKTHFKKRKLQSTHLNNFKNFCSVGCVLIREFKTVPEEKKRDREREGFVGYMQESNLKGLAYG